MVRPFSIWEMLTAISELLSTSDVARLLGVAPDTVRLMNRDGRLRAVRTVSGIRIFQRQDVERMAAERAQEQEEGD